MNVRQIANAAIQVVNPNVSIAYQESTGSITDAAGKQTPTYAVAVTIEAQIQAAKGSDLEHINNLNLEKLYRNVRMFGNKQGVVRPNAKGGDLLSFAQVPGGTIQTWLIVAVLETWPEWCSVIACLQTD